MVQGFWCMTGTAWGATKAAPSSFLSPRCRVQGSGFRVQGSGFRVQGSWFRVLGSGFRVQVSGFKVQLWLALLPRVTPPPMSDTPHECHGGTRGVQGLGSEFMVQGSWLWVLGSGFWILGSGFWFQGSEGQGDVA